MSSWDWLFGKPVQITTAAGDIVNPHVFPYAPTQQTEVPKLGTQHCRYVAQKLWTCPHQVDSPTKCDFCSTASGGAVE